MSDERDPETDQQLPTASEHPIIQRLIIEEVMEESIAIGAKKYGPHGAGLRPHNGRDTLKDLEDELRDALVYIRSARYERDHPPVTDGLREMRDALIALLKTDIPPGGKDDWIYLCNTVEGLLESGPLAKAVSTIRRESFERGASPAVGVLFAELQEAGPGRYQQGLWRAIELLTEADVERHEKAYERGVREGRKQSEQEAAQGPPVTETPE